MIYREDLIEALVETILEGKVGDYYKARKKKFHTQQDQAAKLMKADSGARKTYRKSRRSQRRMSSLGSTATGVAIGGLAGGPVGAAIGGVTGYAANKLVTGKGTRRYRHDRALQKVHRTYMRDDVVDRADAFLTEMQR